MVSAPASGMASSRSALLRTRIQGIFRARQRSSSACSVSPRGAVASATRMARSVFRSTSLVRWTRSVPNSPSSSKPGVSMICTGPRGSSSMALDTGSVVVPLTSETMARSWPVKALTRLDFPALRRPKKAIWTRSPEGVALRLMALPQKRKSRCPCSISRRCCSTTDRALRLGMFWSCSAMTFSPVALVSGEA